MHGGRTDEHSEAAAPSLKERTLERDDVRSAGVQRLQLTEVERERGDAFFEQAYELVLQLGRGVVVQVPFQDQRVAPGTLGREREMRLAAPRRGGGLRPICSSRSQQRLVTHVPMHSR